MDYADCSACNSNFGGNVTVPKVLECGHSTCSICLVSNLATVKRCPICNKPIRKPLEKCPTNYNLIKVVECCKRLDLCNKPSGVDPCVQMKQKLQVVRIDLVRKKKNLVRLTQDQTDLKVSINTDIEVIEKLLLKEKLAFDPNYAEEALLRAKADLEKADKILYRIPNRRIIKILDFSKYYNVKLFLHELFVRLMSGNSLFACEVFCEQKDGNYNFQWYYGKISLDRDWMVMHSLSLFDIPENSNCVGLQDLKRCMEAREIVIFIDVGIDEFRFTPINSSTRTLNFIKLCIGEEGQTLQGAIAISTSSNNNDSEESDSSVECQQGNEDLIKRCFIFHSILKGYNNGVEYDMTVYSEESGVKFSKGDIIIEYYQTYICVIHVTDDNILYENVVAKLCKDCHVDFSALELREIRHCGISFNLDIKDLEQFKK